MSDLRRFPRVIWWLAAAHLAAFVGYSLLFPTYRSPDEAHHVDLAHLLSEELTYPAWDERELGAGGARSLNLVDFHTGARNLAITDPMPRDNRPSFEDLAQPPRPGSINQLTQHPPLYYAYLGSTKRAFDAAVPGDAIRAFDKEVWFYRTASLALAVCLPFAIWATARRAGVPETVGVAAAAAPLAVPQLLHITGAVNNDTLLNVSWWVLTPVVLRLARGDLSMRAALAAGALAGVGMLTKQTALLMIPWIGFAIVLGWRRGRLPFTAAAKAATAAGALSLVIGGWWWIRNLIVFGELGPSRFLELLGPSQGPGTELGWYVRLWLWRYLMTFWGAFGSGDFRLPLTLVSVLTAVVLLAMAVALVAPSRATGLVPWDRIVIAMPFAMLVVTFGVNAVQFYRRTGFTAGLQGRYWFGAMVSIALLTMCGIHAALRGRTRWLPPVVLAVAATTTAVTVHRALDRYFGHGGASVGDQLRALRAWSPLPTPMLVGVIALAVTTAAAAAAAVIRWSAAAPTSRSV